MKLFKKVKKNRKKILVVTALLSMTLNIGSPVLMAVYAEDLSEATQEEVVVEEETEESASAEASEDKDSEEVEEEGSDAPVGAADLQYLQDDEEPEGEVDEEAAVDERDPEEEPIEEVVIPEEVVETIDEVVQEEITATEEETVEEIESNETQEVENIPEEVEYEELSDDAEITDTKEDDWSIEDEKAETKDNVKLGVKYVFPLDEEVTLTFTRLPKSEELRSHLKIERVKVEDLDLPDDFVTDAEYAFDITTDMEDGDFEYDLTLPKSENANNSVSYIEKSKDEEIKTEDIKEIEEEDIEVKEDIIEVKDQNHFSIYIVSSTMSVYASFSGASQITVYPSATISVTMVVETSGKKAVDNWQRSQYLIEGGDWICVNTSNHTSDGTYTESFDITAPIAEGTYDLSLRAYINDSCSGTYDDTVLPDAITVTSMATIPFTETFGSSNSATVTNWYESNPAEIISGSGDDAPTASQFAKIGDNGWICRPFNAAGIANVQLSYDWKGDDPSEDSDHGIVEYKIGGSCGDGSGWTSLASHSLDDTSWGNQTHVFSGNGTVNLLFRTDSSRSDEFFRVDNISLSVPVLPDLTAVKTNNVSGNATINEPFIWTIKVENTGDAAATFSDGQEIFRDYRPSSNVSSYADATVTAGGGASGTINCTDSGSGSLDPDITCIANGSVTIPVNGYFDISFSVIPSTTGTLTNPRSTNECVVDRNNNVAESNDSNNTCLDTITVSAVPPTPNPSLLQACGLDIALVIDNSNSISSTELTQMKNAFIEFVNALAGTPTQFSVTRFGTSATVVQPFTNDTSTVIAAINSVSTGGGGTDWEEGLNTAHSTFDPRTEKPDLMIFASDGNPTFPYCGGGSTCQLDVDAAVVQANLIKGDEIRILALGIGGGLSVDNLVAISGGNVDTGNILTSDVVTSDFDELAEDLGVFAGQLCGGTITVKKYIDSTATPGGAGWQYTVSGTSTKNLITSADGTANTGKVPEGTYSVTETNILPGYSFGYAICKDKNGATVGSSITNGWGSIAIDDEDIISCEFINTTNKGSITIVKNTSGEDDTFAFTSDFGISSISTTSSTGSQTVNDLAPGTYSISETVPTGWDLTSATCDDGSSVNSISLQSDENVTCTFTNTRKQGKLELQKDFVGTTHNVMIKIGTVQDGLDIYSGSLNSDGTSGERTLDTGNYYLSEVFMASGISDLYTTSLACYNDINHNDSVDSGDTVHTVDPSTGEVSVGENEDVLCVFTNTRNQGTIELKKHWVGTPGATTLKIQTYPGVPPVDIDTQLVDGADGTTGQNWVDSGGSYALSETSLPGYSSTLACFSDQNDNGVNDNEPEVAIGPSNNVVVLKDQHVVCTFTNTFQTGTLRVIKNVVDASETPLDPSNWSIRVKQGGVDVAGSPQSGDAIGTVYTLSPGTYQVEEPNSNAGGKMFRLAFSGDCTQVPSGSPDHWTTANITVVAGEEKVCTLTNTRPWGYVIVHKEVDTNGDGIFEGDDTVANSLGFRWGLHTEPDDQLMGTTKTWGSYDIDGDTIYLHENSVPGYHYVGYYVPWMSETSCGNPVSTEFPSLQNSVPHSFTPDEFILCNAADIYCGDGIVNGEEECDYGELNGDSICSLNCTLARECLPNMAANGEFEIPTVTDPLGWDIFTSAQVPGWTAEWVGGSGGGNDPQIELHAGVQGWTSGDDQYAELDSDWDGPGGDLDGEAASISIYQNIPVLAGYEYRVSWSYSPRPNHDNNSLEVKVGDDSVFNSGVIAGGGSVSWTDESYTFVPDSDDVVKISFTETGNPDSYGMFLDNVSIECLGKAPIIVNVHKIVCTDESELPNWGAVKSDGNPITETTAQDWVDNHESCEFEEGWSFQWGDQAVANDINPGDNTGESSDARWHTFDVTDVNGLATVEIEAEDIEGFEYIWMREVWQSDYIPFTYNLEGQSNTNDYTAEIYCHVDVLNYDNLDRIDDIENGETYYCVAWNFEAEPEVDIEKTGPEYALKGEEITYDYTVVNTGNIPLTSVSVTDDKCSPVEYVSGDDGDDILEIGETWEYECSTNLSWTWPASLTNTATATGYFYETEVTDEDEFILYPFVLRKNVHLYWEGDVIGYSDPDTVFTFDIKKDDTVIGSSSFSESSTANMWLSEGTYQFCETNIPSGYISAYGECVSFTTGNYPDFSYLNVITFDLSIDKIAPLIAFTGDTITYYYEVNNNGPASVTPVVEDDLCSPVNYDTGDTDLDGKIDPDETWIFSCDYQVTEPAGSIVTNIANVHDQEGESWENDYWWLGGDNDLGNNEDTESVDILPIYDGNHACPPGTTPIKVGGYTLGSQDSDGVDVSLTGGQDYLFKVSGTYQFGNNSNRKADAAYGTENAWASIRSDLGIWGTTHRGVLSVLADLGLGVGLVEWDDDTTFNDPHVYQKAYTPTDNITAKFLISDWYDSWYADSCNNQSCMSDNSGSLDLEVYECTPLVDVHGYKWWDENNNGLRDCRVDLVSELELTLDQNDTEEECEPLLSGWRIFIDQNENSQWDEGEQYMFTDDSTEHFGWYWFEGLIPGEYRFCEEIPSGWAQTYPGAPEAPQCHIVTIPDDCGREIVRDEFTLRVITPNFVETSCEFHFGNVEESELYVSETNDSWPNVLEIGDTFTYTIEVRAAKGSVNGVLMTNLPPEGFEPQAGTFSAVSSVRGVLDTSGVVYTSPGDWDLGDMLEDEVVTITYEAKVTGDVDPGIYPDLSFAQGKAAGGSDLLALSEGSGFAVNDGIVDENFVGTQIQVNVESDIREDVEVDEEEEIIEQVLGAADERLPATGAQKVWTIAALIAVLGGLAMIVIGFIKTKKKTYLSSIVGLVLLAVLSVSKVYAATTVVRIEEPETPVIDEFNITFVAMDIQDRTMDAECWVDKPGPSGYEKFDTIPVVKGGDSHNCEVTNDVLEDDGEYKFQVKVDAGDGFIPSDEVTVEYDATGPDKPDYIKKDKKSSCIYEVEFQTEDDGQTSYVEVYRSDDTEFTVGPGNRIKTITIGPDEKYEFDDERYGDDCGVTQYYAVRAFDDAGNASEVEVEELVDEKIKIIEEEGTETEELGALTTEGADLTFEGLGEGEVLAEEETAGEEGQEEVLGEETEEAEGEAEAEMVRKSIFRRGWFWVIIIIALGAVYGIYRKGKKSK